MTRIFVTLVSLLFAVSAFAGQKNYGCGLGTVIFGESDGLIIQTFAATTNQSTYTQYFGITSGTSGCDKIKGIVSKDDLDRFVADNMDQLADDIARGHGEYVAVLANLMHVPEEKKPVFYTKLQQNFDQIYPSDHVTHKQVIEHIQTIRQTV